MTMPPSNRPSSPPEATAFKPDFSEGVETGLYLALLELIDEGVIITGDETIFEVNEAACALLGHEYRGLAGQPLANLFADDAAFLNARARLLIAEETRGQLDIRMGDGTLRTFEFTAAARLRPGLHTLILRPAPKQAASTHSPHTQRTTAEQNAHNATADALWLHLAAAIDQALVVLSPTRQIAALNPAAERLFGQSRATLVHRPIVELLPLQEADFLTPAQRNVRVIATELHGAHMNVRMLPGPQPGWRLLLLSSDAAPKGSQHVELAMATQRAPARAAQVHAALTGSQLEVMFQPLVDSHSRIVAAGEALLRWHHPSQGLLDFKDIEQWVESTELVALLSDWTLQQACRLARSWPQSNRQLTVNVSTAQALRGDFVARVFHALRSQNWPAERLSLDFDEGVLQHDEGALLAILQPLKQAGIRLAIDSFAQHTVPLRHLAHLPIDALKLDPALIAGVGTDERSEALVEAICAMAKVLSLKVLARGVSSTPQQAFLAALGCDLQQGPLFGPPLSSEQFVALPERL